MPDLVSSMDYAKSGSGRDGAGIAASEALAEIASMGQARITSSDPGPIRDGRPPSRSKIRPPRLPRVAEADASRR